MSAVAASVDAVQVVAGPDAGALGVRGVLSFATAAQALRAVRAALAESAPAALDLSGVTHGDSAGLACLLAISAEASSQGHPLRLLHLPAGMQTLAGVCGVENLLT